MLSEQVVSNRGGQVLIKNTILKADHFPGCHNKAILPSFEEAPNFRQIPELPIFGVAIPTVTGIRIVLDILSARTQDVLWHNLREEPLLYIRGKPYVVRDVDKPFANLEYTGINRERVEDMEVRLKKDVIQELRLYEGSVLLTGESDLEVVHFWEEVAEDAIQTPQDVFHQLLHQDGYLVDYLRVPVTDEKAPKDIDCDLLIQRCWGRGDDASLVFNCQMGRGRTTTGMIIAALLYLRRFGVFPMDQASGWKPEWFSQPPLTVSKDSSLKQGFYGVVRSLLRILEFGPDAKKVLDVVIDHTNHMQNLREAIHKYREQLCLEQNERRRNTLLRVALEYLERYCVLIAFAAYVSYPQFDPAGPGHVTFQIFKARRPEIDSVLQRLLRRNPMSALGLHSSENSDCIQFVRSTSMDGNSSTASIGRRRGKVLGRHTILKEDHFPGIIAEHVKQPFQGAPNFRGLSDAPVYGVGMPTVNGIRAILTAVSASSTSERASILWFNWREEPLVYINGCPFVLREDQRPFKNLKEYADIDGSRLEKMEQRLKDDIQAEAMLHDGRILVQVETATEGDGAGVLEDKWEMIDSETCVQTPASIYSMLKEEGFAVEYHRIPLTDGATPDALDVDHILKRMDERPEPVSIVFNCQNGVGRTTVGMIIAALAYQHGPNLPFLNDEAAAEFLPSNLVRKCPVAKSEASRQSFETDRSADSDNHLEGDALWRGSDFLAVRRLTRLLDKGHFTKQLLDDVIDRCELLVNIRKEIGQSRRGHNRPETLTRHVAYNRGVANLHRYCFLIAVATYISGPYRSQKLSFQQWIASRPDVMVALNWIYQNPTGALSVLSRRTTSSEPLKDLGTISATEEQQFLSRRQFSVLNATSILKGPRPHRHDSIFAGIPDVRRARHKNVYTVGDPSVESLRKILAALFSVPCRRVIIRDIREELLVYIDGDPYTRRDLERPVSSLYHAGTATGDLERMEDVLKRDVLQEAELHDGQILLHEEMEAKDDVTAQTDHQDNITRAIAPPLVLPVKQTMQGHVQTPKEIYQMLAEEGNALNSARVPLSRIRTPEASDLDQLREEISADEAVVYLIVARSSTGSSARYAAAFFSMLQPRVSSLRRSFTRTDEPTSKFALGEYRSIMHLCRALPNGLQCKAAVDQAIDDCQRIGSLREDILSCVYAQETHAQTKQLGLHYLKRYFFLIAFQCYSAQVRNESFEDWMQQRKELRHLIGTLKLE